jgi:NhaP-type Na+/H+ or K+/H+ antiporter
MNEMLLQIVPVVLGALIGAMAGVAGSWLTNRAQRREQWQTVVAKRDRLIEAQWAPLLDLLT